MPESNRPWLRLLLFVVLLGGTVLAVPAQEPSQLEGVVEYHGFTQIKIAVPSPEMPPGAEDVGAEL